MAEFCIDCLNEMIDGKGSNFKYVRDWGFCEGCQRYTKVVICERKIPLILELIFLPISIYFWIIKFIIMLIFYVCRIIKEKTKPRKE